MPEKNRLVILSIDRIVYLSVIYNRGRERRSKATNYTPETLLFLVTDGVPFFLSFFPDGLFISLLTCCKM